MVRDSEDVVCLVKAERDGILVVDDNPIAPARAEIALGQNPHVSDSPRARIEIAQLISPTLPGAVKKDQAIVFARPPNTLVVNVLAVAALVRAVQGDDIVLRRIALVEAGRADLVLCRPVLDTEGGGRTVQKRRGAGNRWAVFAVQPADPTVMVADLVVPSVLQLEFARVARRLGFDVFARLETAAVHSVVDDESDGVLV